MSGRGLSGLGCRIVRSISGRCISGERTRRAGEQRDDNGKAEQRVHRRESPRLEFKKQCIVNKVGDEISVVRRRAGFCAEMIFERCQRAGNTEPALDDDDRNGQQMEQSECGTSNPLPTTDRSKDDRGLSEHDEQNVRHVEADGRVGGDSENSLHTRLMRQVRPLFPAAFIVRQFCRVAFGEPDWQ